MMNRTRDWHRFQCVRAIAQKAGILRRNWGAEEVFLWTGGKPGRLSKGKIHCSCWMCRCKSRDKRSASDNRKQISMLQQMEESR